VVTPLSQLVYALARLPGFGRRSAERAALALLKNPADVLDPLVLALQEARASVRLCDLCGGFTTLATQPCSLCADATRDGALLCVVEDPSDQLLIERSGGFRGLYHVLHGVLSPAKKTGAAELRVAALLERARNGAIKEIVLALGTTMEGDATAAYLCEALAPSGVSITRLAFGLPADSGIGYSDPLTLKRALAGRQPV